MPFITRLPALTGADPYPDALLALDFVGARRGPQYYKALGVTTADITKIPGWTYTGGTAAGTGSYAARSDGSLQFFPSYTNLLLQSQTFDNASWVKAQTTVTANSVAAPDGTTSADTLTGDGSSGTPKSASQNLTVGAAVHTYSVYAKAGTNSFLQVRFSSSVVAGGAYANFDLASGTIGTSTVTSSTITPVGGGWYRCTVTNSLSAAAGSFGLFLVTSSTAGSSESNSLSTSIYIWGAQLELGSTASTYIPTTTAAVTVGTPRITDAGYWAEEARTNLLLWNRNLTNAAWVKRGTGSVSFDSAAVSADGTLGASLVTVNTFNNDVYQGVSATNAATYSPSIRIKKVTSTGTLRMENSSNSANGRWSIDLSLLGSGWENITASHPAVTVNVAFTGVSNGVGMLFYASSGGPLSFYADLASMELGSFATSPIPTTSVAVTRAADVGYVSGLVVPSAGTMTATTGPALSNTSAKWAFQTGADASNNRIGMTINGTAPVEALTRFVAAGSSSSPSNISGINLASNNYLAMAYAVGVSVRAAANGTLAATPGGAPAAMPSSGPFVVGAADDFTAPFNAPIRRIVIYPRAFGNAELQAITTAGAY